MKLLKQYAPGVFTEESHKAIHNLLNDPGWETGWKSNGKRDGFTFLHKHYAGYRGSKSEPYDCDEELLKNSPIIYEAWSGLKKQHLVDHTLVRCYANGMTYGMDGTVHTDTSKEDNYTFIYYPHERWSPNWGGETLFYNDEETGVIACAYPKPNSAVIFDGRIPHRANNLTRTFPGLRITLMFKTERKNGKPAQDAPAPA